ncbi:MAG TPA: hypothetical protein VIM11_25785 [Tepidisphaeraceae bacterium]
MTQPSEGVLPFKNPNRVAAGKLNGKKRRRWGPEDKLRLRQQCLERRPWEHSTGPKTEEGKYRARANGWNHAANPKSARQLHAGLLDVRDLIAASRNLRRSMGGR